MKIKRYFSHDMRSVIRMVRDELGADAVILSNNRVNGGVEVIAAVDYEESLLESRSGADKQSKTDKTSHAHTESVDHGIEPQAQLQPQRSQVPDKYDPDLFTFDKNNELDNVFISAQAREAAGAHASIPNAVNKERKSSLETGSDDADFKFTLVDDKVLSSTRAYQSMLDGSKKFEDSLFDVDMLDDDLSDGKNASVSKSTSKSTSVWSQEPTLVEVKNEIKTLRNLVEQQLTGLAWGEMARKKPVRAKLLRKLLMLDMSPQVTLRIADALDDVEDIETAWPQSLSLMANRLPIYDTDISTNGGTVVVHGPTGVGKTTTIAKLAARFSLQHGRDKVALICTDGYRIGAQEQLRTFGRILNIPVKTASKREELIDICKSLSDKELLLIDTAGVSQRDPRLGEQLNLLHDIAPHLINLLVLSSNTQRVALDQIVHAYRSFQIDACILTKLDETTNLGGMLSVILENKLPVAYVTDGQKVPEDLHLARAHVLVNRSVKLASQFSEPLEMEAVERAYSGMLSDVSV